MKITELSLKVKLEPVPKITELPLNVELDPVIPSNIQDFKRRIKQKDSTFLPVLSERIPILDRTGKVKLIHPDDKPVKQAVAGKELLPAIKSGLKQSAAGLALSDKLPESFEPQTLPGRIAQQAGALLGDVPAMVGGGIAGGFAGPVSGTIGAFTAPAVIRQYYIEKLTKGEIKNAEDFKERLKNISIEGGKAATIGLATGGAGKYVKGLGKVPAEIVAMVTTGAALEGKLPEPEDFLDAAILIGGLHGTTKLAGKLANKSKAVINNVRKAAKQNKKIQKDQVSLQEIYKDTGKRPKEIVEEVKQEIKARAKDKIEIQNFKQQSERRSNTPLEPKIVELPPDTPLDKVKPEPLAREDFAIKVTKLPGKLKSVKDVRKAFEDGLLTQDGRKFPGLENISDRQGYDNFWNEFNKVSNLKGGKVVVRGKKVWSEEAQDFIIPKPMTFEIIKEKPVSTKDKHFLGSTEEIKEVKSGRKLLIDISKRDPEFKANPVFTLTEKGMLRFTEKDVLNPDIRREYNIHPDAVSPVFSANISKMDIKPGTKIELSPGYLEGRSNEIFLVKKGAVGEEKLSFRPEEGFRRELEAGEVLPATSEKRSEIVNLLKDKFDIPIRTGRFFDKALGIYKPKQDVIRTKFANDIEVISHEIGHALQKFLWPEARTQKGGLSAKPFKAFESELLPLASKPKSGQPQSPEGFAEFIRLYVTNEKIAKSKAPKFYKHFEEKLEFTSPESREILLDARARFDRWIKQPSLMRVLGQISSGEGKKKPLNFTDLYIMAVDDLHPLKKVVQEITKGEQLPVSKDPYKLARLTRGWQGKAETFIEYKTFDFRTYEFTGKSLKDILKPVKNNLDEFRAFIVSKRALELHRRKIRTGIDHRDAKNVINQNETRFNPIFNELKIYQDQVLSYLLDSGVLSKEAYAKMKKLNKDYVPFYRLMDSPKDKGAGKGFEVLSPVKGIKGSSRDIIDPLESIIKNTYLFINVAERNAVGQALVNLASSKEGMGKFVERVPKPRVKTTVAIDEVMKKATKGMNPFISDYIMDVIVPNLPKDTVDIFRPSAFTPEGNFISVWQKGKKQLYEIHPDIVKTIKALDREQLNVIFQVLSQPAKWLRAGAILSPDFIARNPIRDQFSAAIYSKYGYVPGFDLIKGVFKAGKHFSSSRKNLYYKWKISGGANAALVSMDRINLQKNIKNITGKNIVKNPIELLRILSEISEEGTRLGEFTKGVTKEGTTKAGLQEAGFASREVTLDFARMGSKGKVVNSLIAFWNANVQGTDKLIRAFKENPQTTTFKIAAAITLPSIVLAVLNHKDERWKDIPRWEKDLFWIIMTKDNIYRVPKPFELGIIFGTVPERIAQYILNQDPYAFDELLDSISGGAAPGVIPTAALPLMENWANKSYFLDRSIVSLGREKLIPELQFKPYTTETAKKIGGIIKKSPAKIENLIRGWSGGLGVYVLKIADAGLIKAGVVPEKIKPTPTLSDFPVIKAFTVRYPSASTESIQKFFKNYSNASTQFLSIKTYLKQGQLDKAQRLVKAGKFIKITPVYEALINLNKYIHKIYNNPDIKPEEKRRLIDEAYFNMIKIAQEGNKIYLKIQEGKE